MKWRSWEGGKAVTRRNPLRRQRARPRPIHTIVNVVEAEEAGARWLSLIKVELMYRLPPSRLRFERSSRALRFMLLLAGKLAARKDVRTSFPRVVGPS
jgi:hypothetical protein